MSPASRVLVYVAVEGHDPAAFGLFVDSCLQHAAHQGWGVADVVLDEVVGYPVGERPGWRQVHAALSDPCRRVGGVLTWNRPMLAPDTSR